MKMFKGMSKLIAASAFALSTGATQAGTIDLGGISIETGFHLEVASIYENAVSQVGDVLSGYGEVGFINGSNNFCTAGPLQCELTYQFGGFVVSNISPTEITFTGGWVNFYVDEGGLDLNPDFNPLTTDTMQDDIDAATDGQLWLTLAGHNNGFSTGFGNVGAVLYGTGTQIGTGNDVGGGDALFDVDYTGLANGNTVGMAGLANSNFDTNLEADNLGGFADLTFDSSFGTSILPGHSSSDPNSTIALAGSATMRGSVVPAPATVALLGLGLIGLGVSRRKKK